MRITPIELSMVPQVYRLGKETLSTAWKEEDLMREIDRPYARIYVAVDSNTICGFLHAHLVCETASVQNMAVDARFRRRGVGRKLMEALIAEICKQTEHPEIVLEVRSSNTVAQSFYRSCGFSQAGVRKQFYDSPHEDGLLMKWEKEKRRTLGQENGQ